MDSNERRQRLLEVLCTRRHDTCEKLAREFNVCQRTIRYDIEALMCSYPVETACGRYGGGVRVVDGYTLHRRSLTAKQSAFLRRLREQLTDEDRTIMDSILIQFAL